MNNLKIETDIYSFNKYKNNEVLNTQITTKYNTRQTTDSNIKTENNNNFYDLYLNTITSPNSKSKNGNYFRNYFNNSIKKKSLFINNNKENNENKKEIVEFRRVLKPFNSIKYLNIKKIKIKKDVMPLITNNYIGNEILKNKTNFLTINKTSLKLTKPKSLNNMISRKLNLKKNFSNYKIDFFNDYKKDFFPGMDYNILEYNEQKIYKDKNLYEEIIREKINYLRNNMNENRTIKLEKQFHYGKEKKLMKLTLNSLMITLEDMSKPHEIQNKSLKIDFPLALLPIFYYKGVDAFQKLLAYVIKVGTDFENIYFDDNKISAALNNIKDYQLDESKDKDFDNEDDYFNIDINSLYKYISYKNAKKAKKVEEEPIELRPLILQKSKNFLKFNYFIFFWITNTRSFVAKITLPCATLNIIDSKLNINFFLDYEFLFFLYKNNFLNWEFHVIRFLSNYSKFREIFRQLDTNKKLFNKTIFLIEPKSKINTFAEETLFNIYTDKFYNNHIILFKSFYVIINFIDDKYIYEKIYNIYFSFFQYIKLYEISAYSPKIEFLIKFLEINNDIHSLNFNFKQYDSFDIKTWMDNIKKFSEKSLIKKIDEEEELIKEIDIYKKKLKIEFKKPQWTIIKFENDKEISKTWEIGKELELDLVKSILYGNTENWTKLLNECLKKLNEPVPPVLLSLRRKKNRNKHKSTSISNTSSSKSSKKSGI